MINDRIIHQTWKTEDLPAEYAQFAETVKRNNPDFEYRLWTDHDNRRLIEERYPWFLSAYDAYAHGIERVDAVRYFILYTFGGVYIDLDMECLKPIGPLLKKGELFFSLEAGPLIRNQVVSNAFMAANKGNLFFHHIMTHLESFKIGDITYSDVFNNTGPVMVAKQYRKLRKKFDFRIISLDHVCPRKMISQHRRLRKLSLDEIRRQKSLYLIHHNTESWNIQMKCPETEPEGYALLKSHDINGYDIDYVEYGDNGYDEIMARCTRNHDAIGFNFNGYIKGRGGKLEKTEGRNTWMKDGLDPWICIKKDKIHLVR